MSPQEESRLWNAIDHYVAVCGGTPRAPVGEDQVHHAKLAVRHAVYEMDKSGVTQAVVDAVKSHWKSK